jgi:hypothetical protein
MNRLIVAAFLVGALTGAGVANAAGATGAGTGPRYHRSRRRMRPRLASRTLWRMPAQLRQSGGASLPARMVSRTIRPLPRQRDIEISIT